MLSLVFVFSSEELGEVASWLGIYLFIFNKRLSSPKHYARTC